MANIGGITLDISSISEESNVKLSAHELAVYPHTFGELYRAYATSQRKWQLTTAETSANAGLYRKLETLMKIGKSVKVDLARNRHLQRRLHNKREALQNPERNKTHKHNH
jgi:hypothetical protein